MIEKIYLALVLIFFILAFAIRNIKTYLFTKKSIRGKSTKLTLSILTSTLIYLIIISRIIFLEPQSLLEFDLSMIPFIKTIGFVLVTLGFLLGISALIAMKNSWRVGVKHEQKTDLVTSGIYRFSRNPYFLSYNILIFGYILIFPSPILAILYILLVIVFHKMILEEELYLKTVHGSNYLEYQKKTNRYLSLS